MNYSGRARKVRVVGNYAYVASDVGSFSDPILSLQVIDVSDPRNPVSVDYYGTIGGPPQDLNIRGNYAYIVEQTSYNSPRGGLKVVDISNPMDLSTGSKEGTGTGALGVAVSGDTAYVADGGYAGLLIFDASDPTNVTQVGSVAAPYASKVRVDAGYAFVAGVADLQVFDLADPKNPVPVGAVSRPLGAGSLFLDGDTAFIAADSNGLQMVDIRDPRNPSLIATIDMPGRTRGVFATDSYAFVADNAEGLQVVRLPGQQAQSMLYLPAILQ